MQLYNHTLVLLLSYLAAFNLTGCQKPNFPVIRHQDVSFNLKLISAPISQKQETVFSPKPINNYLSQASQKSPSSPSSKNIFIAKLWWLFVTIIPIGLLVFFFRGRLSFIKSKSKSNTQTPQLQLSQFTTPTIDKTGQNIKETELSVQYLTEKIGDDITLEMIYIGGGIFTMGSPNQEGKEEEKPQHGVVIKPFFMGKYPITQVQWRAIAMLPKIKRDLNLDPAKFKGDNRPVENISWYDAVEFCQRLSQITQREYRLPTEAEWEYATRANTKTPFCFGETITTDLANYKGIFTYAGERKGKDRHETTPVDKFPPNAFGLHDLHGNVAEWCADTWHDNYQNAPNDGKAWIKNNNQNYRVCSPVRGGAWIGLPDDCRCASRRREKRDQCTDYSGLRVVCEVGIIVIPKNS